MVRRLADLIFPSVAPVAERGTISKNKSILVVGDITIPSWPRKSATIRTKSAMITPDKSPALKGDAFDLLAEISPAATAEIKRSAAEKGTADLAGSEVGNMAAEIKSEATSAQAITKTETAAELFSRPIKPSLSRVSFVRAGNCRFF